MERQSLGEIAQNPGEWFEWVSHAQAAIWVMHAAGRVRLYDCLDTGPATAQELAEASGISAATAGRLAQYLAAEGVLAVGDDGRFAHTNASRMLQANSGFVRLIGPSNEAGMHLVEALESGKSAFETHFGKPYFTVLSEDAEMGQDFGEFMSMTTAIDEDFIFTSHRFQPFSLAVDAGGSLGSLLIRLLGEYEGTRGILLDLPETTEKARAPVAASAVNDRIELIGGSFFDSVPEGGDLYLLKQILHDWDDKGCVAILANIRAAIAPEGRLAVIDRLLPEEFRPHANYDLDIQMATMGYGRERRLSEFEALFEASGFKLDRVTENPRGPSVIEAVPV